jgi:hypothetical protein
MVSSANAFANLILGQPNAFAVRLYTCGTGVLEDGYNSDRMIVVEGEEAGPPAGRGRCGRLPRMVVGPSSAPTYHNTSWQNCKAQRLSSQLGMRRKFTTMTTHFFHSANRKPIFYFQEVRDKSGRMTAPHGVC